MPLVQRILLGGPRLARGMTTTNDIGLTDQRDLGTLNFNLIRHI